MNERFKNVHSFSDLVMVMVNGLKKEWVEVNMSSYGESIDGVCIGCAATNALCELMGEAFNRSNISYLSDRTEKFNYGINEIEMDCLESGFNGLRLGEIFASLNYFRKVEHLFSFTIPSYDRIAPYIPMDLPTLQTGNYKEELHRYEEFARQLKSAGL